MKNAKKTFALLIALCLTLTSVFTLDSPLLVRAADTEQTETEITATEGTSNKATEASTETTTAEKIAEIPEEKLPGEKPTEISTEDTTEDLTEEDAKELPINTYETDTISISFSDITFKNADGNTVDPNAPLTYTYNTGYSGLPELYLYYNTKYLGTTKSSSSLNYYVVTYYKRNAITGSYENFSDLSNITAGDYQIVLQAAGGSFYVYDSDSGNAYYYTLANAQPITLNITVSPKNLNDPDITCSSISDQTYNGAPLYPSFEVIHTSDYYYNNYTLIPNVEYELDSIYNSDTNDYTDTYTPVYNNNYDYTVEYLNNSSAGQGIIRITGVGNYTGTRDIPFNIFTAVSVLTYSGYKDTIYTGKDITFPGFTASEGSKVLTPGVDYTIAYSHNKKYGEATITVTGMGYYTGTYDVHFGIVPKKVKGIKASSPKKLQAKITWNKCTGADGFEIARYNTKKKTYEVIALLGDGKWQVYQDASTSLKNNVSYKYRIRPYVTSSDGSRRYYGTAATKKCKVTKAYKELNIPIYTGCADVDYAAEVICKKVIKKGMSQQQKVKALYDWTVEHCTHDKDYGKHDIVYSYSKNKKKAKAYNAKIWKQIYTGKADCNFDGYGYSDSSYNWDYYGDDYDVMFPQQIGWVNGKGQFYRTYEAFQTHKGGCSYITRLFKALINHAGLECTLVDGNFKNRDGSKMYHYWCFIRVNKKYAWYDVDIATSHKNIRYTWYKKGAKFWHTCHEWDPKENEKIPSSLN